MNNVTETASALPVEVTEAFEAKVMWFGHQPSSGKAKPVHRRHRSAANIPRHGTRQQICPSYRVRQRAEARHTDALSDRALSVPKYGITLVSMKKRIGGCRFVDGVTRDVYRDADAPAAASASGLWRPLLRHTLSRRVQRSSHFVPFKQRSKRVVAP